MTPCFWLILSWHRKSTFRSPPPIIAIIADARLSGSFWNPSPCQRMGWKIHILSGVLQINIQTWDWCMDTKIPWHTDNYTDILPIEMHINPQALVVYMQVSTVFMPVCQFADNFQLLWIHTTPVHWFWRGEYKYGRIDLDCTISWLQYRSKNKSVKLFLYLCRDTLCIIEWIIGVLNWREKYVVQVWVLNIKIH